MHITKYLGGKTHTEQAGTTWHFTEVKQLQESSNVWYGSNDDTRTVDNPADTRIDIKWTDAIAEIYQLTPSEIHSPFTWAT